MINPLNPSNDAYEINNSAKFKKRVSVGAVMQMQTGLATESILKYAATTKSLSDTPRREKQQEVSKNDGGAMRIFGGYFGHIYKIFKIYLILFQRFYCQEIIQLLFI